MFKDEKRVIFLSIIVGISFLLIDTIIDSLMFSKGSFWSLLMFGISAHDIYFRTLLLLSFFLFGLIISLILSKRKKAEEMLQKHLVAMEASMDGMAILDKEGRYIYLNDAHVRVYGYDSSEELIGKRWNVLYNEEEIKRLEKEAMPVLFEKGRWRGEAIGKRKDGSTYRQEISLTIIEGSGIVCVVRDITNRKQIEEKLKLFSVAVEEAPDGVQVTDLNGYIIYSNKATEKIYGFSQEEFIGKHVSDLNIDPDFAGTQIIPGIRETGHWVGELMVRHKDGRRFPILLNTSIVKDSFGKPIAMIGIIRDITEQKRREDELHRSERFLSTVFDSIRDPFTILDRDFRIIRVNEAYAQMKNKSTKDLIGKICYEVLHNGDSVCDACVVGKAFDTADPCAKDKLVALPDGSDAWIEIYTYPVLDERDKVSHVIEYIRDITDRKKSEEEKKHLIEELQYLSRTDSLTGLLNRRALIERLEYEMNRAKRYGSELSLILCDIDNLKAINDTHGHNIGDMALQSISGTLNGLLRKPDIVGRYGGDEFILILPETSINGAGNLAERIRSSVEKAEFHLMAKERIHISLSLGVTSLRAGTDAVDSLVQRSDNALYVSKQTGRNKVTVKP